MLRSYYSPRQEKHGDILIENCQRRLWIVRYQLVLYITAYGLFKYNIVTRNNDNLRVITFHIDGQTSVCVLVTVMSIPARDL